MIVEYFGQIPYTDYFTNPCKPISVVGDDGKNTM